MQIDLKNTSEKTLSQAASSIFWLLSVVCMVVSPYREWMGQMNIVVKDDIEERFRRTGTKKLKLQKRER